MGNKKSAYEIYKNGEWTMMGVCIVTAINILLSSLGFGLFFPFSASLPRRLIVSGREAGGGLLSLALFGAIVILFCYLACYIIAMRSDKLPAMRCGFVLYGLDTLIYFVLEFANIVDGGFRTSHVIELVFRWFILYTLFQADKVFYDPKRKNPNAKPALKKKKKPEPLPPEDDEEDEGIQW